MKLKHVWRTYFVLCTLVTSHILPADLMQVGKSYHFLRQITKISHTKNGQFPITFDKMHAHLTYICIKHFLQSVRNMTL